MPTPKDSTSIMAIMGFFMVFLGIALGSYPLIGLGFTFIGSAIAIWLWLILSS